MFGTRQPSESFVLIPAFRPGLALIDTVTKLRQYDRNITIVDDGSGPAYRQIFDSLEGLPNVSVLRHAVNLGKGAALKTGLNDILVKHPECLGITTADADGQHDPEDIHRVVLALEADPGNLVLGVRAFDRSTPLRSRFGNEVTRALFRMIHGAALSDTQTGLRGISRVLAEALLKTDTRGYEFELDMLIMTRYMGIPIAQVPIRTIYLNENVSSHFNPLLDSMRIYFLLLRFAAASALTAIVDNLIFYIVFSNYGSTVIAQVVARSVALVVSYRLNRQLVFHASTSGRSVWVRFVFVVIMSGAISYAILNSLVSLAGWPVITAKLVAEAILFLFNFAFLRDFVFTRSLTTPQATDWSKYYQSVPATARVTRLYTTRVIVESLSKHTDKPMGATFLEFGGANSCFMDKLIQYFKPAEYSIADTNQFGLDLLKGKEVGSTTLTLHNADILSTQLPNKFDVVFSIGLIEHFDPSGTAEAVRSHFRHVRPGGLVLISFPRPTFLYRIARALIELVGLWKFPDERPLQPREVLQSIENEGKVVFQKTLWPLVLTQHMILVRANG